MPSPTDILRAACAAAIVVGTAAVVHAAPPAPPATSAPPVTSGHLAEIDFAETLELAQAVTADAPRPIVIQFGATWCGWCRKLEAETLKDPLVLAMAPRFAWVHADVDAQPDLAARFGARALPHAVIIDGDGRVLAESSGFTDAKGYAAFLVRGEAGFVPPIPEGAVLDPAALAERARTLVTTMAPASATGRQQCVDALRRLGPGSLPILVDLLKDERMATRAAAAFALGELARADIGFDPLAPKAERVERVGRWTAWLATDEATSLRPGRITPRDPKDGDAPKAKPAPPADGPRDPANAAKRPGSKVA